MDGMDELIFVRDFGEELGIWYKIYVELRRIGEKSGRWCHFFKKKEKDTTNGISHGLTM